MALPLLAACAAPQATLYERAAHLSPAAEAALAEPAARMSELAWLLGSWRTEITIFATPSTPESSEETTTILKQQGESIIVSDDLSTLLVYDPFARRWITAGLEPPAAPLTSAVASAPWDGRSLVFEADMRILGERVHLRQTMTRQSNDAFEILNEQRLVGRYIPVDRYRFTRTAAPSR